MKIDGKPKPDYATMPADELAAALTAAVPRLGRLGRGIVWRNAENADADLLVQVVYRKAELLPLLPPPPPPLPHRTEPVHPEKRKRAGLPPYKDRYRDF